MSAKVLGINLALVLRLEYLIFATAGVIPLVIAGPQWLTGTVVNLCLFASAGRLTAKQQVFLSILPSLSALIHGLLFGPFTAFLIYFLPFIWLGNWLLMRAFLLLRHSSFLLRIILPSMLKTVLLFAAANLYFSSHLVPKLFLTSMGVIQLATAIAGGSIYILVRKNFDTRHWKLEAGF